MVDNTEKHCADNKILRILLWILFSITTVATIISFWAERYLMDNWAELSADEIVYHLKSTIQGTDPDMVRDGLIRYGLPALGITALAALIMIMLRRNKKARTIAVTLMLISEIAVLAFMKNELDERIGFTQYLKAHFGGDSSDFIAEHYVDPNDVDIKFPEQKRNLVFIFLESAEMTFADKENGGAFERNVIPELTELAQENEDFSGENKSLNGGTSLPGTTWTIGAMFAQSTGLPLKVQINGNHISDEEHFFPNIVSLGTILEDMGYQQELLIGSKASFGGRDIYYTGHGNYQINDYPYALKNGRIPKGYKETWGYEDEKLFQFAREDITRMAESGQPFNLTLLTVDTHFENGYKCRLCRDEFGEQYANAYACSSRQVTEFVDWIKEQSFYENTTIVISGDHPTMDKDFCDDVPDDYARKTYVAVINAAPDIDKAGTRKWREYDTFDMFPTTLAAMGAEIPGNRLGLGVNLYSDEPTIIEEFGLEVCKEELLKPSKFMDEQSGIIIDEDLMNEVAKVAQITVTVNESSGNPVLSLGQVGTKINYKSIGETVLEITDKETREVKTYSTEFELPREDNINVYYYSAEVLLGDKSLDDYDAAFYITAGEVEHFRVADLENNLAQ